MIRAACIYDFRARQKDELSACAGDTLIILDGIKTDENWWLVQDNHGSTGLFPSTFLKVLPLEHKLLLESELPGLVWSLLCGISLRYYVQQIS